MVEKIFFQCSLPRAGSTLLQNVLAQNPDFYATPTSGLIEIFLNARNIYSNNIVNNWERNYRIKQFAEGFKADGRPTLILVERREHGAILESMIEDAVFVPGGDKGEEDPSDEEKNYRRRMLNAVEKNEIILSMCLRKL